MAFNLSNEELLLKPDAQEWCVVNHPTEIDVSFEVLTYSQQFSEHKDRIKSLGRKLKREGEVAKRKKTDVDLTKYEADLISISAMLVTDWRGVQDGDSDAAFDREKLKDLMTTQPWIYDQIQNFQADDSNFFTKPE